MGQAQHKNSSGEERKHQWFNTAQVATIFHVSENVIRKISAEYKPFLKIKKGRRNKNLIHEKSVETIRKIRELSHNGLSKKDIKLILDEGQVQQAQVRRTSPSADSNQASGNERSVVPVMPPGSGRAKLTQILKGYRVQLAQLENSSKDLREENDSLKEQMKTIQERDKHRSHLLDVQARKISSLEFRLDQIENQKGFWQKLKSWFK